MSQREISEANLASPQATAARIDLEDFASALTSGVLRAVKARQSSDGEPFRPWIWAGWILGEDGPLGNPDLRPGSDPDRGRPTQ